MPGLALKDTVSSRKMPITPKPVQEKKRMLYFLPLKTEDVPARLDLGR